MERAGGASGGESDGLSRRSFVQRAGMLGAALATIDLAALLDAHGLVATAAAQELNVAHDTYHGLIAFVVPGNDEYSKAQGEHAGGPGGIAAGAVTAIMTGLDHYIPAAAVSDNLSIPPSGGIAAILNHYAQRVNPAAARGNFVSQFARLSFKEKAKVFELFEGDPTQAGTELRFVAGILPGFAAFLSFSETGVRSFSTGKLVKPAIGWKIAHYSGPAEGHNELRGYYHGHRKALKREPRSKRFRPRGRHTRRRHRRRRRR